jgi:Flp pilus assembly protein TadG
MNLRRKITNCLAASRRGTTVVEVAVTAPLAFLLILGLIIGSLGAFRFQQVAHLAREGASYASVRGPRYQQRTGRPAATSADVLSNAILPLAAGLNPSALTCSCVTDGDANTVTVSVRYEWLPEAYLPATTLVSTSVVPLEQ